MEGLQQRKKFKFDLGLTCTKYMLLALNFVFIIIGVTVVSGAISSKIIFSTYYYDELTNGINMLSTFWLVVGIVFMFVAVFGIVAAFKESTALANLYGIAMVVVFIFQISTAIAGFTLIAKSRYMVSDALNSMMRSYQWEASHRINLDWIQSKFECCGNESPKDWMNYGRFSTPFYYPTAAWSYYNKQNDYYYDSTTTTTSTTTEAAQTNMMPMSCCQQYSNYNNLQCERHYENGCVTQIHQVISESIMLIGSSALVFAVVQILGIVLGFLYARIVRRSKTQRDVLVWNSQSTGCARPVYADYTPIDNTDEVKHI